MIQFLAKTNLTGEEATNSNNETKTTITKPKESSSRNNKKINNNQFESQSSIEISKGENTEKDESNLNASYLNRVVYYFSQNEYQKVLDIFDGYFRKSILPIDSKLVDYLTYSLYQTVSCFIFLELIKALV